MPQVKNTAKKDDRKERNLFCAISKPELNPAIAIDHQGRTKPSEYANIAVTKIDTINFIFLKFHYFEVNLILHLILLSWISVSFITHNL